MTRHDILDQLEPDPLDPDQILAGTPEVSEVTLQDDAAGTSGLWQLTPGTVTDVEVEESFLVLEGRGKVEFEDGSSLELRPGATHRFEGGERTIWRIEETLLKAYWIASS